jgi:DNA-binding GntR family transcriptional regulator
MQSSTIDRPNLSGIVGEHLKLLIFDGELSPGDKIVEEEIAHRLGTSRTPVKLALTELAKVGLVELVPRRGAFVRKFSHSDIIEFYEIRRAVEGLAARLAARYLTTERYRALAEANRAYAVIAEELSRSSPVDAVVSRRAKELDLEFHRQILAAGGNRNLAMLTGLEVIEYLSFLYGDPVDPVGTAKVAREAHERITEAIGERNEARAEELIHAHIIHGIQMLEMKQRLEHTNPEGR